MRFFIILAMVVSLAGCSGVSKEKYNAMRDSFIRYVDADKKKLTAFEKFVAVEKKKAIEAKDKPRELRLTLQEQSAASWKDRQDRAGKFFKENPSAE